MVINANGPTVDTNVNFWPAYIDMLTSVLMFFFLIYFVEQYLNPNSLAAAVAQQKREQFVEALRREFATELNRGDVVLSADLGLLQITFGEAVLFDFGKYDLKERGTGVLRRLTRVCVTLDGSGSRQRYDQIQIEGHTDDARLDRSFYPHDNWELSTARALEVMRFMTTRATPRLDEAKMSVNGYAATRPISRERDRNRRIEIRIYFSGAGALGVAKKHR